MAARTFISANLWREISKPESRFYPQYLAYRSRQISKSDLIDRLPHVAMIGDSVCMNVYIGSVWSTLRRARGCYGKNWFLNREVLASGTYSVSKRLEEITPIVAREYAGIGAMVNDEGERENFLRRILGTRNLSGQIAQLLQNKRFPDLVLISIGHNNADWAWRCPPSELEQPEHHLKRRANRFRENFAREMRRLVAHAQKRDHRSAIVIYGLINFGRYFLGRENAERLRIQNPALYPYLETTYKYFTSFRPAYRRNLVRQAEMINDALQSMVENLGDLQTKAPNVQLRYSNALATADLSHVELLHEIDGWHASTKGHDALAAAAFSALGPSLKFLGLGT